MPQINTENCSIGCMYAELGVEFCQCKCNGITHGMLVAEQHLIPVAECTPSAESRCKSGTEQGSCKCACGGLNHGMHAHDEFKNVPIIGLQMTV